MKHNQLSKITDISKFNDALQGEVDQLQSDLIALEKELNDFEALLRSHLTEELIQEQELSVLYKQQKKSKKEKRLEQKRKGKNYKEHTALAPLNRSKKEKDQTNSKEFEEKKRLYREAMVFVHPDKFAMQEGQIDFATDVTSKLIEIYHNGDLEELQAYHAHIFNQINLVGDKKAINGVKLSMSPDAFLEKEKRKLEQQLIQLKKRHTYQVLRTYDDPFTFVAELKAYYQDRIHKLKKRTRTKS